MRYKLRKTLRMHNEIFYLQKYSMAVLPHEWRSYPIPMAVLPRIWGKTATFNFLIKVYFHA